MKCLELTTEEISVLFELVSKALCGYNDENAEQTLVSLESKLCDLSQENERKGGDAVMRY